MLVMVRAVTQLVEALRCKPEGRGFDSASNRNEYKRYLLGGKGSLCVRLTSLPPPYTDWQLQSVGAITSYEAMFSKGQVHSFPLQLRKQLGCGTYRRSNYSVANRSKPPKESYAQVESPYTPVPFGRTSFLKIQVCGDVEPCRLVELPAIRSSRFV